MLALILNLLQVTICASMSGNAPITWNDNAILAHSGPSKFPVNGPLI